MLIVFFILLNWELGLIEFAVHISIKDFIFKLQNPLKFMDFEYITGLPDT